MREYYALFSCNEWKNHSSMNLIGIFNGTQLLKVIKRRIKKGEFKFGRDFKDLDVLDVHEIDSSLEYGFIQSLSLNEEID